LALAPLDVPKCHGLAIQYLAGHENLFLNPNCPVKWKMNFSDSAEKALFALFVNS